MKTVPQVTDAWNQYAAHSSTSSLKQALWTTEKPLSYVDDLRSVCWKTFLLFHVPLKQETCLPLLRDSRAAYASLRSHFLKAIDHPSSIDETGVDPLTEDEQSLWNALRSDEVVREEIWRDVERCMPDNEYFRDPRVQKLLLDVLFVWCKLNPDVGYRQGMHEIIASLVWVLDADAVDAQAASHEEVFIVEVLDSRFVEHDAFTLFARIMQTAKSYYEQADEKSAEGESPMVTRSRYIMTELLPAVDPELARHLQRIDVIPQIFLMRWIRLLFGREFPLQDVLEIWDLLLSEGSSLDLVDYVCVAMILRLHWELIDADTSTALTLLLRYPAPKDSPPRTLVHDARKLKESTNLETGSALILEYTGRQPAAPDMLSIGPSTPERRSRSPFASVSSPASLEALIQDTARGVLSRGERWGLNQAVRDVVGEVRKGVRGIQESAASSRPNSPRPTQHRARGSRGGSETHGMIAANVLRKMNALEARNRKLADMLDQAVKELWTCHEQLVEKRRQASSTDEQERELVDKLSKSAAQVQLVQGILRDMSLPLPESPLLTASKDKSSYDEDVPEMSKEHLIPQATTRKSHSEQIESSHPKLSSFEDSTDDSSNQQTKLANSVPIRSRAAPLAACQTQPIHIQSSRPTNTASPRNSPSKLSTYSTPPPIPQSPTTDPLIARPRLSSSNFSWMLADSSNTEEQPFSRATPFAPNEKRHQARSGKGFLFGDIDENEATSEQSRKSSPARRGSKAKGKSAPTSALSFETIDLNDVKGEDKATSVGETIDQKAPL